MSLQPGSDFSSQFWQTFAFLSRECERGGYFWRKTEDRSTEKKKKDIGENNHLRWLSINRTHSNSDFFTNWHAYTYRQTLYDRLAIRQRRVNHSAWHWQIQYLSRDALSFRALAFPLAAHIFPCHSVPRRKTWKVLSHWFWMTHRKTEEGTFCCCSVRTWTRPNLSWQKLELCWVCWQGFLSLWTWLSLPLACFFFAFPLKRGHMSPIEWLSAPVCFPFLFFFSFPKTFHFIRPRVCPSVLFFQNERLSLLKNFLLDFFCLKRKEASLDNGATLLLRDQRREQDSISKRKIRPPLKPFRGNWRLAWPQSWQWRNLSKGKNPLCFLPIRG